MIDARHYLASETLRNGLEIRIRALRPDDGERIVEAFSKLDPESVYTRFFRYKKEVSEADLRLIRELDFETRVALVATLTENGREIIIASSSYSVYEDKTAEIAFVVEEDYQGLGIGRRLLSHLGKIARERGITTFTAEVLYQNLAMLKVFTASGWPMKRTTEDGAVLIRLALDGSPDG
ncbi:MAG TPA: GNAT family N-acetyltransferase [Azonexus sp.]|nr:GNAT family N-acetyltransferase [Azonexus sp.]